MSKKSSSNSVGAVDAGGVSLRSVLRLSLRSVESSVNEVIQTSGNTIKRKQRVEAVHGLRVATRRAGAILDVVAPLLDHEQVSAASKRLKRLRSAGGLVRDCDVQRKLLGELAADCSASEQAVIETVRASIEAERTNAWRVLAKTARRYEDDSLKKRHKRLVSSLDESTLSAGEVETLARAGVDRLRSEVEHAAANDLSMIDRVHSLRIACKRLRYGIEALTPWLKDVNVQTCLLHLKDVQAELGRFNDSHQMLCRVEAFAGAVVRQQETEAESLRADGPPCLLSEPGTSESDTSESAAPDDRIADLVTLQTLVTRLRLRVEQDQETAVGTWRSAVERGLLASLTRTESASGAVGLPEVERTPPEAGDQAIDQSNHRTDATPSRLSSTSPVIEVTVAPSSPSQTGVVSPGRERSSSRGTRIAAIDVGSNSTRLIIAEVSPGGSGRETHGGSTSDAEVSYRVLDDERELTRLGKGLDATGKLDVDSMRHAAFAIKRMKGIADGYGVESIRVVATAAVREASNGAAFVELVRQEAGLHVEVISAEDEAMLMYRSASRAFDLGASPAIVVDVGGGSTEVVLSVPAAMRQQARMSPSVPSDQQDAATTRDELAVENGEAPRGMEEAASYSSGVKDDGAGEREGQTHSPHSTSPDRKGVGGVPGLPDPLAYARGSFLDHAVAPGGDDGGGGVIERVYKIPLGAVRLTERFGGPEVCTKARFDEMRREIKRQFAQIIGQPPVVPLVLIGTGGTFSSLGSMCAHGELGPAASGLFAGAVQGYEVKRPQVMHLLDLLRKMPVKERGKVPGLNSDRADIIVAGLALVDRLMKYFGVNQIRVHDGGVRDGVLLAMAQEIHAASSSGRPVRRDPLRSVKRFARACGYEQAHSRHVAKLCLRVFDQLAREFQDADQEKNAQLRPASTSISVNDSVPTGPHGSHLNAVPVPVPPMGGGVALHGRCGLVVGSPAHRSLKAAVGGTHEVLVEDGRAASPRRTSKRARFFTPENRILLEAAALLHDVGYLINYSSHHKHSYHLIMHADLPGLTRRDVEVIANVGRYHRLSEPKMNHRNFAQLAKPDRRLVRVLAGILRVCDGLDRTHTQCVEGIDVIVDRRRSRAVLGIKAATEPSVDIWGAQRKSGLFAKAVKLEPVLEWQPLKGMSGVLSPAPAPAITVPDRPATQVQITKGKGVAAVG